VPGLDGLHDPRHLGRDEIDALALGHGERPRVRATDRNNRDADDVQAGDHGYPRDADPPENRVEPFQRRRRLDRAVRSVDVALLSYGALRHP
jgi:hypothetical protein